MAISACLIISAKAGSSVTKYILHFFFMDEGIYLGFSKGEAFNYTFLRQHEIKLTTIMVDD